MTQDPLSPPPALDCARVLAFAILNDSIKHAGRTSLYVGGKELGPVPRLAICDASPCSGVLLLHCDADWNVLGIVGCESITDARENAEKTYPGVSACWVDAQVTLDEAEKYLDEIFAGECCSFCGRRPDQLDKMISKHSARICNHCIEDFYRQLHE
jgi:hypothetical protein